jgi:hypothetical protein
MSGVITFSDRTSWLVAGWAWRQLLERAIVDAESDTHVQMLEETLYTQGLNLSLLDVNRRAMIIDSLIGAARGLLSDYSRDETEIGREMRDRLSELITRLESETRGG